MKEENIGKKEKKPSRVFSILSISFGCTSLYMSFYLGSFNYLLPIAAIIMAFMSRSKKGSFDALSVTGLIGGIASIVYGVLSAILALAISMTAFVFLIGTVFATVIATAGFY